MLAQILSASSRATGMGIYYTIYYLGTGELPAVAGWLQEASGDVETAIWFSAICLVLSPLSLLAFWPFAIGNGPKAPIRHCFAELIG